MTGRLQNKVAIIIGAGQSAGEELGNGRATTIRFAQEGARILAADLNEESAQQSLEMAECPQLDAIAVGADTSDTAAMKHVIDTAIERWGRIDVLHYNVGISIVGGPQTIDDLTDEAFERVHNVNLRGAMMACKFVAPFMRNQGGGAITLVSSMTAIETYTPTAAYRTSKAGMIAYMQLFAAHNAEHGIRCNAILPGLMQTAMAVDTRMGVSGRSREDIIAERNSRVPLRRQGGTGWDIANAALFLASDEANFITGAALPVDGGTLTRIGWC